MLVYASYNRGYRSGAFNGGSYTGSQGINFVNPERINAYELGMKGRFLDRRLALSAAAFYYDYSNQQLQDLRPGPVGILVNAPKSRVLGGEVEVQFRASDALFFNASAGYLDSKYKQLLLQGADLAGNELPFAPHLTLQGSVDIRLLKTDNGDVTFTPSASYFSRQYFTPLNLINAPGTAQMNSELQQAGYAKVNATLAWRTGPVTLKAWVNNLFNQENYIYGIDLRGAGFPYNFKVPDMPRTWGASVRYTF
jgi:outer membrane receptor protein involved in Fe transport